MELKRSAGVLLHITSLPGPRGVGDLGTFCRDFIDFLAASGQSLWQMLPLGPTIHGDSPYSCYSAFAGNPLLISIEGLVADGFLEPDQAEKFASVEGPAGECNYAAAKALKHQALELAFQNFSGSATCSSFDEFESFCVQKRWWLDDFALFSALMDHFGTDGWTTWEPEIAKRESDAIGRWRDKLASQVEYAQFVQYAFHKQWSDLRSYAASQGVQLFGDMPIFVAHGSADVWAHQSQFCLNAHGNPSVVAGVPPDYFSKTGQLWGNPLYDWDAMQSNQYHWWTQRFRSAFDLFDLFRIDHFRGFESYWEVPASAKTAVSGKWIKGPGVAPFRAAAEALGELPIVAEDLGLITEEVHHLRDELGFPGMRVFQFGFDSEDGEYHRPDAYPECSAAYTGTHDNDTIMGWYNSGSNSEMRQELLGRYLSRESHMGEHAPMHWRLIESVFASKSSLAIIPMQDLLGLGNEARLNMPGLADGNWRWRASQTQFTDELAEKLHELTNVTGRL